MQICFFTDQKSTHFHPLTLTRPVDDLRIGLFTIREKWQHWLSPEHISRIVPEYLEKVFSPGTISENNECLWINPRFLPTEKLINNIRNLPLDSCLICNGEFVAGKISGPLSVEFQQQKEINIKKLTAQEVVKLNEIRTLCDLFQKNAAEIENDIQLAKLKPVSKTGVISHIIHTKPENIYIDEDVTVEAGVIIDATNGAVVVQKGAILEAGCILKGPVAVCENAVIKMGARVFNGTTVGPVCKVGGEVSSCIFHSYTNKAHDGYAGNSIFGQWINLGANTVTSNLKNDYSNVKLRDWTTGETVDSGTQFCGTVMGDHSKTAINTALNTGTICGVSSNVFRQGLTPTYIRSFSWMSDDDIYVYRFDKALQVMELVMKRRNVVLSPEYRKMMKYLFDNR